MKQDSYVRFLKSDLYKASVMAEMEGKPLPAPTGGVLDGTISRRGSNISLGDPTGNKEDSKKVSCGNKRFDPVLMSVPLTSQQEDCSLRYTSLS